MTAKSVCGSSASQARAIPPAFGPRDLVTLPAAGISHADISAHLQRDGAVIVENFVSDDLIDRILSELRPIIEAKRQKTKELISHVANALGPALGARTARVSGLFAKSKAFTELALNNTVHSVAADWLLPNCANYMLNVTQLIEIGPGEAAQFLHRDDLIWPHPYPKPEMEVTFIFALNDFTRENGATCVVPGSHLWHRERTPEPHEITQAAMKRGSVLCYTGSVIHGGGPNSTESGYRMGLLLQFALGWLRQEENQYVTYPPDVARTLPTEVQALIGYQPHGTYLGLVDMTDPRQVIAGDRR